MFLLNMLLAGVTFAASMGIVGVFIFGISDGVDDSPKRLKVWNIILFPYWVGYGLGFMANIPVGSSK